MDLGCGDLGVEVGLLFFCKGHYHYRFIIIIVIRAGHDPTIT